MKLRYLLPTRILTALLIGAGCAVYAPFTPFAFGWTAVIKFAFWGAAGLLCTFGLQNRLHKRLLRYTVLISFFLALSFALGAQLQDYGTLSVTLPGILSLLGIWALSFLLLCHLFVNIPGRLKTRRPLPPLNNTALLWSVFISFFVLACVWLLAYYPIMTNYDIHAHLLQIAAGQYETHHSLLYTLLMQGLLQLGSLTGFGSTGAFLLLGLLQAAVMGLTVGYGLVTMNSGGADRRAVLIAAAYYCVFPLFGYFAFSTTKDTLFSCFSLLTAIEFYRLSCGAYSRWGMVRITAFAVLMCLMRYNGILTLLLFAVFAGGYALIRRIRRKKLTAMLRCTLVLLPVTLVLTVGVSALLNLAAGATTPATVRRDILSLPLQQMARVLQTAGNEADIRRIEGLFGVDDIRDEYRPDIADPVKAAFLYPDENTANALRAWLKLGVKYPGAYLEAFLNLTRGAWFVDDLSHTKIDYWLDYTGYLETVQKYTETDIPIAYRTIAPALRTFLERTFMQNRYLEVPLVRYFFALAMQTWIAVIALLYASYHRRRHAKHLAVFALFLLLPILLLPCMISRYFLPLFMLNPLCLLALTNHKENTP